MSAHQTVVAKIGTSSITDDEGRIAEAAIVKLCDEVAGLRAAGHRCVIVTSGAIAAGLPDLGLGGPNRPRDSVTLQAVSAVGQGSLIGVYQRALRSHGLLAGQVLLAPLDFMLRSQYLHARATMQRLLELGVVPVVNENDAIADDEIRFGDNDRLAALVAHLVDADAMVLLSDIPGLLTADPRRDASATLIEEIVEFDHALEALAGGAGSARWQRWHGVEACGRKDRVVVGGKAVIAQATRPDVLADALAGVPGVGTVVVPKPHRLSARKLWIVLFAVGVHGRVTVDDGAREALLNRNVSLLAPGVRKVEGDFETGDAIELCGLDGTAFAKGLVRYDAETLRGVAGRRTSELPEGASAEVVHRDDLVVLP